jgi:hypothetical protein
MGFALSHSGLLIALGIAGIELLYGIVKYAMAPTTEARREGVQELQNMVYGAVFAVVMGYYVERASIIAKQLAGLFTIGGTSLANYVPPSVKAGLGEIYNEELGPLGLVWELVLFFLILGALAIIPYTHTLAAVVNNYLQLFLDALKYTILNGVALYAIGLFLMWSAENGVPALMTALLIPNRTRNFAASFVATYLVLAIAWPIMVAVFNAVYFNYANLLLTWFFNSLPQSASLCQVLFKYFPWFRLYTNSTLGKYIIAFNCATLYSLATGFQGLEVFLNIFVYAFWMIVYDILLDVAIAIIILVIKWVAGLIEEGAGALFTMGKIG